MKSGNNKFILIIKIKTAFGSILIENITKSDKMQINNPLYKKIVIHVITSILLFS